MFPFVKYYIYYIGAKGEFKNFFSSGFSDVFRGKRIKIISKINYSVKKIKRLDIYVVRYRCKAFLIPRSNPAVIPTSTDDCDVCVKIVFFFVPSIMDLYN